VKPHESPFATFANNPIWFIDPSGDDFENVHTKEKEKAKEDKDKAKTKLESAKSEFKPFEEMGKKGARDAGLMGNFRSAKKELRSSKKEFDREDARYQQEVEFEAIVNDVLEKLKEINPDLYEEWDKWDPHGTGVINIPISVQNKPVDMIDPYTGMPTGQTTTAENRITVYKQTGNVKASQIIIQVRKLNNKISLRVMTGDLVHELGHMKGGKRRGESEAVKYQQDNFDNFIKK